LFGKEFAQIHYYSGYKQRNILELNVIYDPPDATCLVKFEHTYTKFLLGLNPISKVISNGTA